MGPPPGRGQEKSAAGAQVNLSSQDLSKLAEQLRGMVNQFRI